MKYCGKCGKELFDEAVICPGCGCPASNVPAQQSAQSTQAPTDASSFGFAFLSFCFPLVGLILYLVWKDNMPLKAKSAGTGALIGVITLVAFYILYFVFIFGMIGVGMSMSL